MYGWVCGHRPENKGLLVAPQVGGGEGLASLALIHVAVLTGHHAADSVYSTPPQPWLYSFLHFLHLQALVMVVVNVRLKAVTHFQF